MEINKQIINEQEPNTLCNGKYCIDSIVGLNSSGITYRAKQSGSEEDVYVLQYLPKDIVESEIKINRQKFLDDARTLQNFSHENIIKVLDIFEENNTAYMVIPFIEGKSKDAVLKLGGNALQCYDSQIKATKDYIKTQGIAEDLFFKANFLFLQEQKVVMVKYGIAQVFDNDGIPEMEIVNEESKANTPQNTPSAQPEKSATPKQTQEAIEQQVEVNYKHRQQRLQNASLACRSCKRPLPICRCQKK
jgi:serine/threonine protein kinase